ncbi:hypothetical protein [Pandoraea apista]|uniref:hypothetical protein n=1 Tax=Pandoraea apista TaxID=93218 RepID=UPI00058AB360|nr:hypothetical protein [Pandoraea apista]AJF00173.1 hypothetical protein SG18_21940 [Pandoraea apista]AKH74334.1 hypothetical protein XM39_22120 [Pandoraea apista]AKI62883.1 hypothetical protein AA956_15445 [Pandoraea apista]
MYESHYVGLFMYYWGWRSSELGAGARDLILQNSQNPFDSLFGDIAGNVGLRHFIVEFKTSRGLLVDEVSANCKASNQKPHRNCLYNHLQSDPVCRNLSMIGHFGAFAEEGRQLIEPYFYAVQPENIRVGLLADGANVTSQTFDWDKFHEGVTESRMDMRPDGAGYFQYGLGWTSDQLSQYVRCMYAHLVAGKGRDGHAMLCSVNPETGEMKPVISSFDDLIEMLELRFQELELHRESQLEALRPKGPRI